MPGWLEWLASRLPPGGDIGPRPLIPTESQQTPAVNALDYQNAREMYGREPRQGEMQTELISPMSYLAGQVSGANVAGGAPGPRFGTAMSGEEGAMMRLLKSGPKTPSGAGSLTGKPAVRTWDIPTADQAGIYDALNAGKKKYGGSYAPGQAHAYDLTPQSFEAIASQPASLMDKVRQIPAPPVNFNDPAIARNAEFLRRLGLIQ